MTLLNLPPTRVQFPRVQFPRVQIPMLRAYFLVLRVLLQMSKPP